MSASLGDRLPEVVCARLAEASEHYRDRAIVICSVDDRGWPHAAMVSTRELFAVNAHTLSLTAGVSSRTAANLRRNGRLTVILADYDGVFYVKGDASPLEADSARPAHALFTVHVVDVLEDAATEEEEARIVSGIRVQAPGPSGMGTRDSGARESGARESGAKGSRAIGSGAIGSGAKGSGARGSDASGSSAKGTDVK